MNDGPDWFAAKRFGIGAGLPIAWQGWALSIVYAAIMIGAVKGLHHRPLAIAAIVVPVTILFMLVSARTTRGGWRWRWGRKDKDG